MDALAEKRALFHEYAYCARYGRISLFEARQMTTGDRRLYIKTALDLCQEEAALADRERADEYDTVPRDLVR